MTTQYQHHQHNEHADHELLTLDEAAAILRTPKATLRYWRHLGTGPHSFRLGRRVVYRRGDVDEWINAKAVTTGEVRLDGAGSRRAQR